MRSYKEIAQSAGTDIETVRKVAKTIKRDERGAWITEDGKALATKAQAIVEACKTMKAAKAKQTKADADYTPRVYAPMDVAEIHDAACKAIETHTPAEIEADGVLVHDDIVAVDDVDAAVTTKHFGNLGTPGLIRPWKRADGEPATMRTGFGGLKAVRRVDYMHEWYESMGGPNRRGERITIELDTIDHGGEPGRLLTEWAERGYIRPMAVAWCVDVRVTGADGSVYQGYNPQISAGGEIAWPWILPATEDNRNAILCEILERFGRAE